MQFAFGCENMSGPKVKSDSPVASSGRRLAEEKTGTHIR